MQVVRRREAAQRPELSVVLLDWSVRESFHGLDYLARQTVPRERYELIWIEYYDARPAELDERVRAGSPAAPDQWIVLGMPHDRYYHKHLMYNVGLIASRGRIVNFCDSDAMFEPTYVESILAAFDRDPAIVLHLDEIRTASRRFYPFDHPSFEEVLGSECINLVDGKPAGIAGPEGTPVEDRLHVANYGASMSARRADLVAIGGADEHEDYLGHVCGPYDMTFRLVNHGLREVWHRSEWLYHTWHPGQAGAENYLGPHDGHDMSTTALRARRTGRVQPLRENPGVRALREAALRPAVWADPLELASAPNVADAWSSDRLHLRSGAALRLPWALLRHPRAALALRRMAARDTLDYLRLVLRAEHGAPVSPRDGADAEPAASGSAEPEGARGHAGPRRPRWLAQGAHLLRRARLIVPFARGVLAEERRIAARAVHRLDGLRTENVTEVVLFGTPSLCRLLESFAPEFGIRVVATIDESGVDARARACLRRGVRVLVAARYGIRWRRRWLVDQGFDTGRIQALEDSWEDEEAPLLPRDEAPRFDLSLVLPTRGRPEIARRALAEFAARAAAPDRIEVLLYVDEDDPASHGLDHPGLSVQRIVGPPGVGMGTITNECVRSSHGRFVMLGNDDVRVRTQGWDRRIVEACEAFEDGVALVHPDDGHQGPRLPTFPIVPRAVVEELGSLAASRVNHFHIESHLRAIFEALARAGHERRRYLGDVLIEHVGAAGTRPPRAQVRGGRDDRATYATLREERQCAARRLARRIAGRPPPPRDALAPRRRPRSDRPFVRGTPELSVCWLGEADPASAAAAFAEPGVDFELLPAGPPGAEPGDPDRLAPGSEAIVFLGPELDGHPGWGAEALAVLRGDPRIGALAGAVLLARNDRVLRAGLHVESRAGGVKLIDRLRGLPADDPRTAEPARVDGASLPGLVVRASAWRALGGLAPFASTPTTQGLDLGLRLSEKGFVVAYAPGLRWWLREDEDPADAVDLAALLARHPIEEREGRTPGPSTPLAGGLELFA